MKLYSFDVMEECVCVCVCVMHHWVHAFNSPGLYIFTFFKHLSRWTFTFSFFFFFFFKFIFY